METYYKPEDLAKFPEIGKESSDLAKKFFDYYEAVFSEGELTEREKALIALAVAHAVQCPYCIDAYAQACLRYGQARGDGRHTARGDHRVHGLQMRTAADKMSM